MAPGAVNQSLDSTRPVPGTSAWDSTELNNGSSSRLLRSPANLYSAALEEVHDLVGVGFGPASLAIAIALSDRLQAQAEIGHGIDSPKVRFLERQKSFKWHAGMLLPGAKMQISFIKDLATLRDPCSHFTFLNYLKEHDRLVQFTNLCTFLPSRLEFDDYLQWAAGHFGNVVEYSRQVESIHPRKLGTTGKYDCFEVVSRNLSTGQLNTILSRNVVIAAGGRPARPAIFPAYHERILHSSEYQTRIAQILPDKDKAYNIAIVGAGQSGAEVFNDLHSRYPNAATRLIFRDTALRPSDDSPFVNEVFNPEAVDTFFEQPEDVRYHTLKRNKATNYSVVRLELIEKIYDDLYLQGIKQPDKTQWQHQVMPTREVTAVAEDPVTKKLSLTLTNLDPLSNMSQETLAFDAVVLATGYRRDAHIDMLRDCQCINANKNGVWQPGRDYGLKMSPEAVEEGMGIWLQGCNESTHGLSDSLLSILSTRSGEMVDSIFGRDFRLGGH
ncbi:L-ornithine N5-oxygenase [Capronia coronata CBS 617.96]|uniref:L-ornithine N(5)-monooxygenase n=1 Tax=Capronia coronata CBS 617.96 TaxID=1182541 RepID=W9Y7F2_9EURO|nr:L-ornithine N5-oxygenase [Capronia coronata CBS 617.96]EXJ88438.1 L-ornithine N5-oxygenase [Capronia coronata CBS 617.96]